ncbi:MAG: hypothetical protein IPK20_08145, partial [Betaproteobacteria bacterium]|nr:hypothetical protein [Betaproteobacteria bacterium]
MPAFLTAFLGACSTTKPAASQLERIAKDWALGIRASQVIPVYPLTEDLQPGDVFLVQTPVEEQTRLYLEKGFLPLENLVTRLRVSGYQDFYVGWPGGRGRRTAPALPLVVSRADAGLLRAPLA